MSIELKIGDAIPREEIDSPETLNRIREEVARQGFKVDDVCGTHGSLRENYTHLIIAPDCLLLWTSDALNTFKRIIHVSDLLNTEDEPQGHPAAPLLREIAEAAERNPRPWEEFEWHNDYDDGWYKTICMSDLLRLLRYVGIGLTIRRKPRTVTRTLDGVEWELPAPETEAPERGTPYYTLPIHAEFGVRLSTWDNDDTDNDRLIAGLVHLSEENARCWLEFLWAVVKGDEG